MGVMHMEVRGQRHSITPLLLLHVGPRDQVQVVIRYGLGL